MHLCIGAETFHYFITTVLLQLLIGFQAFGSQLIIRCMGLYVFQFKDIAMKHFGITDFIGQQQEIAVTLTQFNLGFHQIEAVQSKIGFEEPLQVMLT